MFAVGDAQSHMSPVGNEEERKICAMYAMGDTWVRHVPGEV